jgi:two-component system, OmpR family, sensor kinase
LSLQQKYKMRRFFSKLYVRIWLAVVLSIAIITIALGALWRYNMEQGPWRELLLRNDAGEVIGSANTRPVRVPGQGWEVPIALKDGQTVYLQMPHRARAPGEGPPPRPWRGVGIWGMLVLLAAAVALGAYPIVRRLTQRLENLQRGVQRWGEGDLHVRVDESGHDEVAYLAQRFNQAAARVEQLLQSQKSLLANASHELRSPLTRIRMGLELMAQSQSTPSASLQAELSRNISELDTLIDEILTASRLDAAQADQGPIWGPIEAVDLTGLVAEECARANAPFEAAPDAPSINVQGNARLLRRLVRNLLENARRYSPQDLSATLARHPTNASLAVLGVHDRGPGVPQAERERIFEPFYRAQAASEHQGGVGLGLALVKSIAQRHGGGVRCEARAGGGASFVVELPCA